MLYFRRANFASRNECGSRGTNKVKDLLEVFRAADIRSIELALTLNKDKIFVRKCWRDNWNMKRCVWQTRFYGSLRQFISLAG